MGKGGSQPSTTTQYVKSDTSNLPEYAKPYYQDLMSSAKGLTMGSTYQPYGGQRIADFTPAQQQSMQNILNQQTPGQFGMANQIGAAAGLGALQAGNYTPGQFSAQQIGLPNLQDYQVAQQPYYRSPQMGAAQSNFGFTDPGQFGQAQANQYMSPYTQSVIDVQKNEAIRDAKKGQLVQDLGAASQGTYGGSRQLLAGLERERNLGTQLGNIQAQGQQAAYENAQQQFERDRAAGMQGQQMGLQQSLANLDARSQANVQNLAAKLQTQGMNADQALKVALANQQSSLTTQDLGTKTGLQALMANQQYGLEAQKAAEQSRQFGSQQGLAGANQLAQLMQTYGNLGQMQGQLDQSRLNQQLGIGTMDQALQQQALDTHYQDYLRQQGYPLEMLQQYSSLLRGVPVTPSSQTTYSTPTPSAVSQILSTGLGALGASQALR